jgi:stage II sporulation protein M
MKFFKNNFVVKFIIVLFLISIIFGLIAYFSYKPDLAGYLEDFKTNISSTNQNVFLLNLGLLALMFVLSISIIGIPLILFYIFYEGFSAGFTVGVFISIYKLKGLLFYLLFFLVSKLIFILLTLYFSIMCIRFSYHLIDAIIHKNKESLYRYLTNHFYRFTLLVVITLINSTIIYFFSNNILEHFLGLL